MRSADDYEGTALQALDVADSLAGNETDQRYYLKRAQVFATLAVAAATEEIAP